MKIIEIRLCNLNHTVCCTQPQKFPQSCCAAALGRTCRRRLSSWHRTRHRAAGGSYDPWGPAGDSSFFEGCLGRIRHPEQRVVSNMFCYVVFLTGFCPCPAPKLKSDMIPWGVRPSAFVFTSLQEGYRQSWITHDPGKARVRDESGEGDPAKSWKLGSGWLIQAEFRNQLRRLRGIGFSWCSWGFDVSWIMNWIIINQFIITVMTQNLSFP